MHATKVLMDEHRGIEQMLDVLEAMAHRLETGEEVVAADLERALDFLSGFADKCHHAKEEGQLFPALVAIGLSQEDGPIGVMLAEHVQGRGYIAAMREALPRQDTAAFAQAARGYAALLRQHILKEDRILYPLADQRIADQDEALLEAYDEIELQVTGPGGHEAYHQLLHELVERYL